MHAIGMRPCQSLEKTSGDSTGEWTKQTAQKPQISGENFICMDLVTLEIVK
jgi:hypothetical protein